MLKNERPMRVFFETTVDFDNSTQVKNLRKEIEETTEKEIGTIYGYARVSAKDQNLDRQIASLMERGIEKANIYMDKSSGKNFERPSYQALRYDIKEGDVIMVTDIDRLGRDYDEILDEWFTITKKIKAYIMVLNMPLLDTTKTETDLNARFFSEMLLRIVCYCAEIERRNIKKRQMEGIRLAQQAGAAFGRPKMAYPPNIDELFQRFQQGEPTTVLYEECDTEMCLATFRNKLKQYGRELGQKLQKEQAENHIL